MFKSSEAMRSFAFMIGPSETLLGNCTALWHVDNAAKYAADYEKLIEASNKLAKEAKKSLLPTMELEKIQVNGTPAMHVEVTIAQNQQMPGVNEILRACSAPAANLPPTSPRPTRTRWWPATRARRPSNAPSRRPEPDRRLYRQPPELAKTAPLLPAGAHVVAYISPEGVIDMVNHLAPRMMPVMPAGGLPPFAATPPIGVAVKVVGHQVQTTIVVPAAVLAEIGKYQTALREQWAAPQ